MTNAITCTCTEHQLYAVGCDCEASRQFDIPQLPTNVRAVRQNHFEAVIASARSDYAANVDNSAKYAASSADFYAYVNEMAWLEGAEV